MPDIYHSVIKLSAFVGFSSENSLEIFIGGDYRIAVSLSSRENLAHGLIYLLRLGKGEKPLSVRRVADNNTRITPEIGYIARCKTNTLCNACLKGIFTRGFYRCGVDIGAETLERCISPNQRIGSFALVTPDSIGYDSPFFAGKAAFYSRCDVERLEGCFDKDRA